MTFQLTLETLLVFGAPGLLALVAGTLANNTVKTTVSGFFTTPNAALGIAIFVIVFLLGALVDTLRAALLDPALDWWFRYRDKKRRKVWLGPEKQPPDIIELRSDYLSWLTDKNLPVFNFIIERTHAYYRLSANTLVVSLAIAALLAREIAGGTPLMGLTALLIIGGLLHASVKARRDSFWAVTQFSNGEERRCALDSHAEE